jgi:phospholipid/cholesterol/gamma-HCH transport system substrate-binding protein
MARRQYTLLVGLFALAAVVVLFYMTLMFGAGSGKYRNAITVTGVFNQAGGLIEKAPVFLSGVEIGLVQNIEVTGSGKVHIQMRVAQRVLRQGDVPEIAQRGVLGDVIVNFIRGEEPGELAPDNYEVVGKDPVDILKQAQKAIDLLTSPETVGTVHTILNNVAELTKNLAELSSQLSEDLGNLRRLFTAEFFDNARTIVENARKASDDLPELTREGTLILRDTRTNLIALTDNLTKNAERFDRILASIDEILGATARGEGTFGNLVQNPQLYNSAASAFDQIREMAGAFTRNAPFGIGKKYQAELEAEAAEAARRDQIWRR